MSFRMYAELCFTRLIYSRFHAMPLPARHVAQWIIRPLPPPFHRQPLISNDTVRRELISSLELYSEIRDLGQELLHAHGHPNSLKSFRRFQAYVRQGVSFFNSAETLPYRSSPLLFYYSFMNLAKAASFLRDPHYPFGHINHGLTPGRRPGGLASRA
jgi:hypothetical protein